MSFAGKLKPWSGVGYRHLPSGVDAARALDFSRAGLAPNNRWNVVGEPTLYIAGDVGIAIAEWARHYAEDRAPLLVHETVERTVYRLGIALDRVLDLRDAQLWAELQLDHAPSCFLDRDIARATARFLRSTTRAQALLVPSVAMLDKLDRWNMVLFLEKLPVDPTRFITDVQAEGPFRWR